MDARQSWLDVFVYAFILHNYPILVRSTGIEDIRRYEKSLDFQGFFAMNANVNTEIWRINRRIDNAIELQKGGDYGG